MIENEPTINDIGISLSLRINSTTVQVDNKHAVRYFRSNKNVFWSTRFGFSCNNLSHNTNYQRIQGNDKVLFSKTITY